ncbi:hypothetical protein J0H58_39295, partial [bacterium]|nr:hypothetical protein [bacterium]
PLLGEALAAAGDLPAAERVWGRVAAARPTEPEARFRLFGLALDRGDEARARALAAELARLEGPVAPLAAFAEAALHARRARQGDRGAIGPAREAVARAAAARPAWPLATLLEAELCELGGEKDRAAERYEAVVAAGRAPAAAVKRLVHLLAEQGRYADARGVLARLPDQAADAEFARADAQLAILGATGRDAAQARRQGLEAARRAVGPGATDYREYLWLGEMALLAGEPVEAAAAFRRACELSPAAPEPCVAIVLLLARSDVKAAEAELEVARARIPADLLPRVLAVGYEAVGKRAEAGEQYRAMAAARPDDPAALRDLSAFLARTGDLAGAEQTLRRTLALGGRLPAPAAAWVRRALAVVLVTRGGFDRLREAGSLVDHAAAPDATDDDRWTRAIVLAAQPARRREAIDILEKLTVPATASPDARFLLAKLYDQAGRWPMARAELAGLARAGSPNPDHLAYFAAGLVRRGELAEAEQW